MDSMISCVIICVVCFPSLVAGKTSISFDPVKTPLTESVDITCTLTESSSAAVTWNFGSTITSCGSGACTPNPLTHTFSMSGNVFTLTLPSAAIGNCVSYSCADALNNTDTTSADLSVAYFDKADLVATEPGANTDGTISVTTGCVLSPSDLTIVWYKIEKGKNEEVFTAVRPNPIDTSDRSTCTRTCHSEEDKKVTHGFNHKEFTGDGSSVEVQYKVTVTHNSYPDASDQYTWTSATYKLEAGTTVPPTTSSTTPPTTSSTTPPTTSSTTTKSPDIPVVIIVPSVVVVILIICIIVCILLRKKSNRKKKHRADPENVQMPQVDINEVDITVT